MTLDEMREIALSFPGATEGSSYGQPSFLVNKKFFTRLRREDDSMVILEVSFDEREMLIERQVLARKNQHRVAAVDRFTCETKTLPESGKLRQWENIEQQRH